MANLNFPAAPTANQIYTDSNTGNRYIYNATYGYWSYFSSNVLGTSFNSQVLFNDGSFANGANGLTFNKISNTLFTNTVVASGNVDAWYILADGSLLENVVAFNVANFAYNQANAANVLAFNTGIGANAFTSATIAGANTAVGAGANTVGSAAFATANIAVANVNYVNTAVAAAFAAANIAIANVNFTNVEASAAFTTANIAIANVNYVNTSIVANWVATNAAFGAANVTTANVNYVNTAVVAAFSAANVAIANVNYVNTAVVAAFAKANSASIPAVGIAYSTGTAWGASYAAPAVAIAGTTDTQTLTNKRITPRVQTTTGATSPITPTGDTADMYTVTALAVGATINAPSGTPTDGQRLILRIKDNGTARSLTFTQTAGAYRAVGITFPTQTTAGKVVYFGMIYNAQDNFWDVVAYSQLA